MKAWELLDSPSKWTQSVNAKNQAGDEVPVLSDQACSWCVLGAVRRCYTSFGEIYAAHTRLSANVGVFVADWNDSPVRTYQEVHAVLKSLDI